MTCLINRHKYLGHCASLTLGEVSPVASMFLQTVQDVCALDKLDPGRLDVRVLVCVQSLFAELLCLVEPVGNLEVGVPCNLILCLGGELL